jgi:hypothetical protein
MNWLFWRSAPEVLLGLTVVFTASCSPNQDVAAGPPVLVSFSVIDNATGGPVALTDDAGAIEISGFVHLTAYFDRLLDPVPIAHLDDAGIDLGGDAVLVTITPALPATATAPSFNSSYSPNGGPIEIAPGIPGNLVFGPGPSITTSAAPTFPSGATIAASLDKTKVRSKKGEPFTGDGQLTFHTLPFAASISVPEGMLDPDAGAVAPDAGPPPVSPQMQAVTVSFTNVTASDIATHITITAGGIPFTAVKFAGNDGTSTTITATPTDAWPANTTIVVTVDATAADPFGATIGQAAAKSFTTSGM